jgi:hypothetical protein
MKKLIINMEAVERSNDRPCKFWFPRSPYMLATVASVALGCNPSLVRPNYFIVWESDTKKTCGFTLKRIENSKKPKSEQVEVWKRSWVYIEDGNYYRGVAFYEEDMSAGRASDITDTDAVNKINGILCVCKERRHKKEEEKKQREEEDK